MHPPALSCDKYFFPGQKKRVRYLEGVIRNAESHARPGFLVQYTKGPPVQPSLWSRQLLIDLILLDRKLFDYGRRTAGLSCVSASNTAEGNPRTAEDGIRNRTRSTV